MVMFSFIKFIAPYKFLKKSTACSRFLLKNTCIREGIVFLITLIKQMAIESALTLATVYLFTYLLSWGGEGGGIM